jgi:hypothetical protein
MAKDFLEADFWTGMVSGEPVIPQNSSAGLSRNCLSAPIIDGSERCGRTVFYCPQWTNRNVAATKLTISREGVLYKGAGMTVEPPAPATVRGRLPATGRDLNLFD